MRSLILFLWKHRFFLLFLALEAVSGALIVSNNSYQRSKFISASNGFTGNLLSFYDNIETYFSLKKTNEDLVAENARLRNRLKSSFLLHDTVSYLVNDTVYKQRYRYFEAKVISNSFQKRNNYLILSKGGKQGLYPEMGVITHNGVLGIVNSVSDNFSTVISILHSKSAIDAKLLRTGYTGTISWDGSNYRFGKLDNIPSHVEVNQGDTVVTSGYSSIFPEGILIGTVVKAVNRKNKGFYDITVKFSVDYNRVEYAYVIFNMLKDEEKTIKEEVGNE
jgi:rod shape-determining protein MreC